MEVRYGPTADHSRFAVSLIRVGDSEFAPHEMNLRLFSNLRDAERYADRVAHAMEVNAVKV